MWKTYNFNGNPTNYECDENGHIRSKITGHLLQGRKKKTGYIEYELYIDKNGVFLLGHRIVAQTFLPNPNNFSQVNHIDGNKENNSVSNLEWCDASYNNKHAWDTNLNNDKNVAIEVIQCDMSGKELKRFHSIAQAKQETGICKVREAAFGSRKSAGGYIWKLADETYQIRDMGKKKKVGQYDRENNLIAVFDSVSEASRKTKCYRKGIGDCCNGILQSSSGYVWKFL